MRLNCRLPLLLLMTFCTFPMMAHAQTVHRSTHSTTRKSTQNTTPKPDRRATLLLQVMSVIAPDQAIVNAISSSTIEKPVDLTASFPLFLTRKTKYHFSNVHTNPFTVGRTIVVRTDLFGMLPHLQGTAREIWDIPVYEEEQRLRKEVAVGKVVQGLAENESQGTLIVAREDGTQAAYHVTNKSRFCRSDIEVPPSTYVPGMPIAVKPRALPSGGAMAGIVAESSQALEHAYRDTLSVWRGTLERADMLSFYFVIRREDGVKRSIRFPKLINIITEEDAKKAIPQRTYQFAEIMEKPIIVHLVRGERPGLDGTRTAVSIFLSSGKPSTKPRLQQTVAPLSVAPKRE